MAGGEVVVKTVFHCRANSDLGAGKQLLYRLGQQVGGGVTQDFNPRRIPFSDYAEGGITFDNERGINLAPVHDAGQCRLGQARTNIRRDISDRDRLLKFPFGTIG